MSLSIPRYHQQVRTLCDISLRRLPKMIEPKTGLFVFRVDGRELVPRDVSVRYTAITLLGLERAADAGLAMTMDLSRLYEALDRARPAQQNCGDLGLILWAAARKAKPLAERALGDLEKFGEFTQIKNAAAYHSTELAWVAMGLTEALANNIGHERTVRSMHERAYSQLLLNRGASGLMGFSLSRDSKTWVGRMRSELGFFDAQVYTILASLRRDEIIGDPSARNVAEGIGRQILRHQYSLGQWAWHYNARTGHLVDLFPVYSVHQDGMAPMAVFELERRLGIPTQDAVMRGVDWLFGNNEIGTSLVDEVQDTIWRSVKRRMPLRRMVYPLKAMSLAGLPGLLSDKLCTPMLIEIDYEFRPYHLGWCLYAFSNVYEKNK